MLGVAMLQDTTAENQQPTSFSNKPDHELSGIQPLENRLQ